MSWMWAIVFLWIGAMAGFFLASMFMFGDPVCKRCGSDKL